MRSPVNRVGGHLLFEILTLVTPWLVLPLAVSVGYVGAARYFSPGGVMPPSEQEAMAQREQHRLASIVFVPWKDIDTCELRHFDNWTGRISFGGTITCELPPAANNANQQLRLSDEKIVNGHARMRAIHEAFKK